ncbi:MAG TPA: diguanylate cyclase, partial [Epsilonproteobacteria bacterium]|nr:diguanylate cyclase [Campylobacterota bacterium]
MTDYSQRLQRQLLDSMYKQIPSSVAAHIVLALLVSTVFYIGGSEGAVWWLSLVIAIMICRIALYRYYLSNHQSVKLSIFKRVHFTSIFATALAWGIAPWLYFGDINNVDYKVFFGFVMAGLTSGAVTTLSADRKTFLSFEIIMLGSMTIWFFSGSSTIEKVMGIMSIIYFLFLFSSSKQIHATLYKTFSLQDDNLRTKMQLDANKRRVDLLFDNVPAGIFFYDSNLIIKDVNEAFAKLLNVNREQLLGLDMKTLHDQRIVPALKQPLGSKQLRQGHYEGKYRSTLSGVEIDVRATTTPLIDKTGNRIGAIGVVENIQKEMEQKQTIAAFAQFYIENPNPVFQVSCPNAEIAVENSPAKLLRTSLTVEQWESLQYEICHSPKDHIEIHNAQKYYHFDIVRLTENRVNLYGRDITEERKAKQRADYLAYYDELTDLPRRELFFEHVKVAMKRSARHGYFNAIMFLDLDNFKQINDTMGHDTGDELLVQLALRLKNAVRDNDVISRFGGDEFVLLLEDLSNDRAKAAVHAKNIADKIQMHLLLPFPIASRSLHFSASIGITLFEKEQNVYDLLKEADVAMYEAKKSGKNNTKLYDSSLEAKISEQSKIMQDLHLAIERKELMLYYQT